MYVSLQTLSCVKEGSHTTSDIGCLRWHGTSWIKPKKDFCSGAKWGLVANALGVFADIDGNTLKTGPVVIRLRCHQAVDLSSIPSVRHGQKNDPWWTMPWGSCKALRVVPGEKAFYPRCISFLGLFWMWFHTSCNKYLHSIYKTFIQFMCLVYCC